MRAIINGRRYNTETAEALATLPGTEYRSDFRYHETDIYRTKAGRFFLAGHGNAMSMWSRKYGDTYGPGQGIRLLTENEAREYLEQCQAHDALERYFTLEDA